ncbi:hypothetical protein [Amycolatopsis thermoflava]|uniref:hypothetical protein n=1 Tax=Amycolatopsis thermoflava TaxID=84480 RepID=UPI003EC0BBD9
MPVAHEGASRQACTRVGRIRKYWHGWDSARGSNPVRAANAPHTAASGSTGSATLSTSTTSRVGPRRRRTRPSAGRLRLVSESRGVATSNAAPSHR